MKKIWVYSGRPSESAALLVNVGDFYRMKYGKYWKPGDLIINWGNTGQPPFGKFTLNQPEAVALAVNKLKTFKILAGHNIPTVPWTSNRAIAKEWQDQGATIVARKVLTGHEGNGIIIVEKGNELVEAPLYTKYIFKEKEFRVHATQTSVIDTQWKIRDPKREPKSWKIRSYGNGFIFQRKNIVPSAKRDALAISAIKALGLDFGALDIIEDKHGNFFVLEINTAPGIEGTTVELYANALKELALGA